MALDRHAADCTDFAVLRCGAQCNAGLAQPVAHALEVAAQDGAVENEGGRRQVVERLVSIGIHSACRSKTNASLS
jgi:hypothetical protein